MKLSTWIFIGIGAALAWPAMKAADARAVKSNDPACAQDLDCLADRHKSNAMLACQDALRRNVPSVELTHGFMRPFFSWQGVGSLKAQTVAYTGRAARVQIAVGTWQDLFYRCTYDPKTETLTDIDVQNEGLSF